MQKTKDGTEINFNSQWWIKHDMNTLAGRFLHFCSVTNPMNSFVSADTLKSYQQDLEVAKNKATNGVAKFTD